MQSKKAQPLSGEGNKRLKKHRPTNNAETAAWADIDQLKPESKVSVDYIYALCYIKQLYLCRY